MDEGLLPPTEIDHQGLVREVGEHEKRDEERLPVDVADALQVADIGRVIFAARHCGSALKPVRFVPHLSGMRGTTAPVAVLRNV